MKLVGKNSALSWIQETLPGAELHFGDLGRVSKEPSEQVFFKFDYVDVAREDLKRTYDSEKGSRAEIAEVWQRYERALSEIRAPSALNNLIAEARNAFAVAFGAVDKAAKSAAAEKKEEARLKRQETLRAAGSPSPLTGPPPPTRSKSSRRVLPTPSSSSSS